MRKTIEICWNHVESLEILAHVETMANIRGFPAQLWTPRTSCVARIEKLCGEKSLICGYFLFKIQDDPYTIRKNDPSEAFTNSHMGEDTKS